jgi:hypothetical protein
LLDVAPDDPTPGPFVIGSDVTSTDHKRPAGVAECFQCSEDGVSSPSSEIRAVFKSEPTRADFSDNADSFEVEAAALAFDAFAFGVGAADVLAGGASDDNGRKSSEISKKLICCERADIVVDSDTGIVLLIKRAAPVDEFTCGYGIEAGTVHAKRPTTSRGAE